MADPVLIQTSLARDPSMVALATIAARISDVDVDAATVMDTGRVAAGALDHLADRFGILGSVAWRHAAGDAERRDLIRRALRIQVLKGTRQGVDEAARAAGAEAVQVITPPARMYLGAALTDEQRRQWLARHAQLRIYRERNRGTARPGAIYLGDAYVAGSFAPRQSDAPLLARPRVFLVRQNVETELTALEFTGTTATRQAIRQVEIREKGSARGLTIAGWSHAGRSHLGGAIPRVQRVVLAESYTDTTQRWTRLERPSGLEFISVRYESVFERYTGRGAYLGKHRHLRNAYLADDHARDHVFRRYWLADPAAPLDARPSRAFLGQRLGIPRHTADVRLRVPMAARGIYLGRQTVGRSLAQPDLQPLRDALRAQVEMMRMSDRLRLSTITRERLAVGPTVVAGRYRAGEYVAAT